MSFLCLTCSNTTLPETSEKIERLPVIDPDYTNITLPPNIAPTNFIIQESGRRFIAELSGKAGASIIIHSKKPTVQFPISKWRKLLQANRGETLTLSLYIQDENKRWRRFQSITNTIAEHDIESHLAYRLIKPLYVYWDQMGLYQRDLTSFNEKPIFLNRATDDNCVNCHSFHDHNPDRFLFHMRAASVGTGMMLVTDGQVNKIDTSTPFNRATAYRAWHPNGELIAFSANTVNQFFHTVGENRDVYDKESDIVLYNIKTNTITTSPDIATVERMETYPEWSPDGKHLYFCVTDGLQGYEAHGDHPYSKIKYDLMRIAYNADSNTWGELELVMNANAIGQSVTHPKVSPDGKYVLFCMSGYGNFSIYKQDSDLYLLDTASKAYKRLDILNSDKTESYHAWSQDGRWVVFSSKRRDGLCARPFFSYVEKNGEFSKPFILPQKDPAFYHTFLKTYNIPEFIDGPVTTRPQKLAEKAWDNSSIIKAQLDPNVESRQSQVEEPMWKPVEKRK
jgi:hypothetical protein